MKVALGSANLQTGVLLLVLGLGLTALGAVWVLNYRGFTTAYHAMVIRHWNAIPLIGPHYRKLAPFGQFRYLGGITFSLFGLALCAIGIATVVAVL